MQPLKVSCADHEGARDGRIQQWDGKKWKVIIRLDRSPTTRWCGRWSRPRRRSTRPRRSITPRDCSKELSRYVHRAERSASRVYGDGGVDCSTTAAAARDDGVADRSASRPTTARVNNIEVIYNHVILVLKGVSLAVPRGRHRGAARRQRRRQDDDAEGDLQPAARRARRGHQGLDRVRRRARRRADAQRSRAARRASR